MTVEHPTVLPVAGGMKGSFHLNEKNESYGANEPAYAPENVDDCNDILQSIR